MDYYTEVSLSVRFVLSLARVTLKGTRTDRIYYLLIVAAVLVFFLTPYFASLSPRQGKQVALDFILATQSVVGLVVAIFVGAGLISKDIENKILYSVISRPVSRTEYVLGRFAGIAAILLPLIVILSLLGMASYFVTNQLFPVLGDEPNWTLYWANMVFLYIKLLILSAVAFLFSSFSTSTLLPLALTVAIYIAGTSAIKVKGYFEAAGSQAWGGGFKLLVNFIFYLLPNLSAFDLKNQAAYALPVQTGDLFFVAFYGVIYISVVLSLTAMIFKKRDLL
jgi:Cu-processing system permease protein